MEISNLLKDAVQDGVSDIFLIPGSPVTKKVNGIMQPLGDERLTPSMSLNMIETIYEKAGRKTDALFETGDDDFSFSVALVGRFRCNAFRQGGSYAAVLRVLSFNLPNAEKLFIPDEVLELCSMRKGLVLVTGPAGSGKSTTLACMIDRINSDYDGHIITIEDPIEYLHPHKKSIVSQREVEHDTQSYGKALRGALRQAPNVIFLGEMRDFETMQTAMTAAETGQLVLSTLHTIGAAKTIDRIIDVFPSKQQQQIRVQLSMVLRGVVSQQLLPTVDGGQRPAFEIMRVNGAIQNMIRENKIYQIDNVIYSGAKEGMRTMDGDIQRLLSEGVITEQTALACASDRELMGKKLGVTF